MSYRGGVLDYYLRYVCEHPSGVVIKKAMSKMLWAANHKLSRLKAFVVGTAISDEEFLKNLDGFGSIEEFVEHIRQRESPNFFIDPLQREDLVSIVKENFVHLEDTIFDAEKMCSHIFDLLGSGDVNLDEFIDGHGGKEKCGYLPWHYDFKSGYRWDRGTHCREIRYGHIGGVDVKVPWELSRFQHLAVLGKAYWYTGDEKYAKEFVRQICDWIDSNPPQFGVNWACTMDVAIRAINWIWGHYLFKHSSVISDEFLSKFLKSLLIHARHIKDNLENESQVNGNHYLSNLVGLVCLGVMFPEFKEARKWREFGVQELIVEMDKQVYRDGVDFEASTSYHRLATELFLSATILCLKNAQMFNRAREAKTIFPDSYTKRLEKMVEFVMYYTKPGGTAPQIGDNDDGRLHILSNFRNWNRLDHRYLLCIGAVLFDRTDFKKAAGRFHEEAFWLLGEGGLDEFNALSETTEKLGTKAFPDAGIYVMRKDDLYMIVDCGSVGKGGAGTHAHNDTFGFELCAGHMTFIVDPGAYIYTADLEKRNLFRSTSYHNTVVVDGEEQNRFYSHRVFGLKDEARPEMNCWESTAKYDLLDAQHDGYERLPEPVIHRRQIRFDKRRKLWIIKDSLIGKGKHKVDWHFHFDNGIKLEILEELAVEAKCKSGISLFLKPMGTTDLKCSIIDGWVSKRYGLKQQAAILRYSTFSVTPLTVSYLLIPSERPYLSSQDRTKEILQECSQQ